MKTDPQTSSPSPLLTKLTDPYDKPPFCNDQPAKVYIRLPLAEKRLIKVIHPEDNVYQYVISNLWYKLCRKCEQLGITNFNDLERFVDLVVNSTLESGDSTGLSNRPASGTSPQGGPRNDELGTSGVPNQGTPTPNLNSNAQGGDRTTSGGSRPGNGTSLTKEDEKNPNRRTTRKSRG